MILIGEAGGTKTDWQVISTMLPIQKIQTSGFNLFHTNPQKYLATHSKELSQFENISKVYFYLAGKTQEETLLGTEVHYQFQKFFSKAEIILLSDVLAACRALCFDTSGWVGILGTGANMCYYDGKEYTTFVNALGYILGDEGGGVYLGKKLLTAYLRQKLPSDLKLSFQKECQIDDKNILQKIYKDRVSAKSFLGNIAKYILQYIQHPFLHELVFTSFEEHIFVFLKDIKKDSLPVHYSGSVAFYFSDVLKKVFQKHNITLGKIIQCPIKDLVLYHQQKG